MKAEDVVNEHHAARFAGVPARAVPRYSKYFARRPTLTSPKRIHNYLSESH